MSINMDKPIAKDLINFKLRHIMTEIDIILKYWNEENTDLFLQKAREGILEEAENDAIELRHLLQEEKKLRSLLELF